MAISEAFLAGLRDARWFRGRAPYLVLDRELRIRLVNEAYEQATGLPQCAMVGEHLFEALPDNPADPAADGVAKLGASLETVLSTGTTHWMGVQRYDVRQRHCRDRFVRKVWVPVNSPLRQEGRTVGVLHHVEDVTHVVEPVDDRGRGRRARDLESAARALGGRFPDVPFEALVGMVADSCRVVMGVIGYPDLERVLHLATLRLEASFGRPALPEPLN